MAKQVQFRRDNPGGHWLKHNRESTPAHKRNRFDAPESFGATTAWYTEPVLLPVDVVARFKGMRGEHKKTREDDFASLKKYMEENEKCPPGNKPNEQYFPFVMVDQTGECWVNEGNHRIKVAKALGWKYIPVQVQYHLGGEEEEGSLNPTDVKLWHGTALRKGYSNDNDFTAFPNKQQYASTLPQVDDKIEFMGDRFTDKGPATGTIVAVDGNKVSISFHDEVEEFDWKEVGPFADVRGRLWLVSNGETAAMNRLNIVEARVESEMQLAAEGQTWFAGLSKKQKDEYIALHPNSKYVKDYTNSDAAKNTKKKQDKQARARGETVHRSKGEKPSDNAKKAMKGKTTEKADVMPAMDVNTPAIQIVVQAPRNVSDAPLIALIGKIKKSDENYQTKKINGKEVLVVNLDNGGVLILGKSSWAVAEDEKSNALYSGDSYMDLLKEMKSMDSAYARAVRHIVFVDKKF